MNQRSVGEIHNEGACWPMGPHRKKYAKPRATKAMETPSGHFLRSSRCTTRSGMESLRTRFATAEKSAINMLR